MAVRHLQGPPQGSKDGEPAAALEGLKSPGEVYILEKTWLSAESAHSGRPDRLQGYSHGPGDKG